jgi:methionyl-tRNA formyltransferase
MRLLVLSSDPIALPLLEGLLHGEGEELRLVGVVTTPDRRAGRGQRVQPNPVAAWAREVGVPVAQQERVGLADLDALPTFEAALVFAYGQILSAAFLDSAPAGFFNFHPSPLPLLRGPSPLETALAEGWEETELCLVRMVEAMDAGPVGDRTTLRIHADETGPRLRQRAAEAARDRLPELARAARGELPWREQLDSLASYCRKIRKEDGVLDFSLPARQLEARARAFHPWPGTSLLHDGVRYRVDGLSVETGSGPPGEILAVGDSLVVATGEDALAIPSLQRPSRRMLPFAEAAQGLGFTTGEHLPFSPARPLVRLPHSRRSAHPSP